MVRYLVSLVGVGLSLFLILGLYRYLSTAPFLQVKEITLELGSRVDPQEVVEIGGLKTGKNLLSLDIATIKSRIEKLPWVKEASIRRIFPDGLRVSVDERRPFALIHLEDSVFIIDDNGVVFKKAVSEDAVDLPVITGIGVDGLFRSDKGGLNRAIRLLRIIRGDYPSLWDRLSEIRVEGGYGLRMFTTDEGAEIYIGERDFDERLRRYEVLARRLGGRLRDALLVDLDYKDRVIVRWRTPEERG